MQSAVAVVLLTLLGPSILSVVCELTCVNQEHAAIETATRDNCHDQASSATQSSTSIEGRATVCHQDADTIAAMPANVRIQNAEAVDVLVPSPLAADRSFALLVLRPPFFSRLPIVLQTTPLRI